MNNTLLETDKAYIAALLDVKLNIRQRKGQESIEIDGSFRDVGVVELLIHLIGGRLIVSKVCEGWKRPCAAHCPDKHVHVPSRTSPKWILPSTFRSVILLYNVEPYMQTWGSIDPLYQSALQTTCQYYSKQRYDAEVDMIGRGFDIPWKIINSCMVPKCDAEISVKNMCRKHYDQERRDVA